MAKRKRAAAAAAAAAAGDEAETSKSPSSARQQKSAAASMSSASASGGGPAPSSGTAAAAAAAAAAASASTVHDQDLAMYEARDLQDLLDIAAGATVIEFDAATGRPVPVSGGTTTRSSTGTGSAFDPIDGIVKISATNISSELMDDLRTVHNRIKATVKSNDMAPWAGVGGDTTRLRAFGFLGQAALDRLDASSVRLHAVEKVGGDADEDERANRRAICILDADDDDDDKDDDTVPNAVRVAKDLCSAINPARAGLDPSTVCADELIAYQTNLHNGAQHLAAHLDWPLHEGFGRVIVTVAIRGSATILLISGSTVGEGDDQVQPAFRFHLREGEAYVLSDNARNKTLHAVLADDVGGTRESLNLRFGIHTDKEAEEQITRHWPADTM